MRFWLGVLIALWMVSVQAFEVSVGETDIPVQVIGAKTQPLVARVVWLPSEYGVLPQEVAMARKLAEYGVESWLPDLFEAYFLSPSPSRVRKIPTEAVVAIFAQARADGVPVYLVGTDRGAILALRAWQGEQAQQPLSRAGILLINPNLYVATPKPGKEAVYWPETKRLNAPVYLFQAELSPWRWRLKTLLGHLETGGSDVFVHLLPKVRDRFYFRPDALPVEKQAAQRFPQQLLRAMALLTPWMSQPRTLPMVKDDAKPLSPTQAEAGKTATLVPYDGPQYPPLVLEDLTGKQIDMRDLSGKVLLVNFWASWCPPCVHEMPSMAALKRHFAQAPFEILAVNLAEEKPAIEAFLQRHPVNFPILLDPTGQAVKSWRVFAYPSSYLLDKQGRIRYAAFGTLDWNSPEVRTFIRQLIAAPVQPSP